MQVFPFCATSCSLLLDATDASISTCLYYKILIDDFAQCITIALTIINKEGYIALYNLISVKLPDSILNLLAAAHRNSRVSPLLALRSSGEIPLAEDALDTLYTS